MRRTLQPYHRARVRQGPRGQVPGHALAQGARVTPLIVDRDHAPRAPSLPERARLSRISPDARAAPVRDGTMYGRLRASPTSFFVYHMQRLSKAAACGNVDGIEESINDPGRKAVRSPLPCATVEHRSAMPEGRSWRDAVGESPEGLDG